MLCKQVYSIERIDALNEIANQHFQELNYNNIEACIGNGYAGWPEHAPYDGIIVTAAATHIPEQLIEQLKPGSNLVIPVGLPNMHQELMQITKDTQGEINVNSILGVAFVPLIEDNIHPLNQTIH